MHRHFHRHESSIGFEKLVSTGHLLLARDLLVIRWDSRLMGRMLTPIRKVIWNSFQTLVSFGWIIIMNYYYELLLWIIRGFDTVSWHWIWFIQSRPFLAIFGDAMPKERKRGNQRKLGQRRLNRFCRDVNKPMIVTTWSMTLTLVY